MNNDSAIKWLAEFCALITVMIGGIILIIWYLLKSGNIGVLAWLFFILAGWGALSIAKDTLG